MFRFSHSFVSCDAAFCKLTERASRVVYWGGGICSRLLRQRQMAATYRQHHTRTCWVCCYSNMLRITCRDRRPYVKHSTQLSGPLAEIRQTVASDASNPRSLTSFVLRQWQQQRAGIFMNLHANNLKPLVGNLLHQCTLMHASHSNVSREKGVFLFTLIDWNVAVNFYFALELT
jgi:hypothetical protein